MESSPQFLKLIPFYVWAIPTAVTRWNEQFENLNWEDIFTKCFKSTPNTQLRWFQARLWHRILPTNINLFIRKVIDISLCTFCGQEYETTSQLFCQCQISHNFGGNWKLIDYSCTHCTNSTFSVELIFFGCRTDTIKDISFDPIVLLAKCYIYKFMQTGQLQASVDSVPLCTEVQMCNWKILFKESNQTWSKSSCHTKPFLCSKRHWKTPA